MSVLTRPTLVLNRNWQVVHVKAVADAMSMLWTNKARAVDPRTYQLFDWDDWAMLDPEDGLCIRTPDMVLRVPEIVSLVEYSRLPRHEVSYNRRNVHKRDRYTCQYCGAQGGELTLDHVIPRSRDGASTWDNCVTACLACNRKKADKTLKEAGMKLRKQPERPGWSPMYALKALPLDSWQKFVSEAYWQVPLQP